VFERFHNFLALSQWGNMVYNMAAKLEPSHGDPSIRTRLDKVVISVPHVPQGMLSRYGEPRTWPIAPAVAKLLRNIGVRYGYKSGPGRRTTRVRSHIEHGDQMRLAASAGRAFKYRQMRLPRGRGALTGA
jgi:hypothetical protein